MFHYDRGLKITAIDLAVDARRRQPRGFISHAHMDHMGRHELAFCTPATARLYWHRYGRVRHVREMPYGEPLEWNGLRLKTFPAGHVLGSAMLLVDDGQRRLLYTGDFKLGESATAEPAIVPPADLLVMESTFGDPKYRLPPRAETIARLLQIVEETRAAGRLPILHAYVLGKAQEVTRILTGAGVPVAQTGEVFATSRIYEQCGCPLGDVVEFDEQTCLGRAVVVPPRSYHSPPFRTRHPTTTIAVTGWANDPATKYRLKVDHALPLTDHADYGELLETIERVQPQIIYCTHGPASFIDHLRTMGHDARPLEGAWQKQLF